MFCDCCGLYKPDNERQARLLGEMYAKFRAELMLVVAEHDRERTPIVIPTQNEWVGFNLLERDDQRPKELR